MYIENVTKHSGNNNSPSFPKPRKNCSFPDKNMANTQ